MNSKLLSIFSVLGLASAMAFVPDARAEYYGGAIAPAPLVFSVMGPGKGYGALNLGLRGVAVVGKDGLDAGLPMVGIDAAYGLSRDWNLFLNISTVGIGTFTDLGVAWRILGSESGHSGLALRAAISPAFFFSVGGDGAQGGALFAATPGAALSFGGERVQFTLGMDVPMYLGAASAGKFGSFAGTGFEPALRPMAALELPIGKSTNLTLSGNVLIPIKGNTTQVMPMVGLGIAF